MSDEIKFVRNVTNDNVMSFPEDQALSMARHPDFELVEWVDDEEDEPKRRGPGRPRKSEA